MAGALGLEPRTKVLETHVLPLHHTPKPNIDYYTAFWEKVNSILHTFSQKMCFYAVCALRNS